MPELPEVETVRQALERHLVGCQIVQVATSSKRLREPLPRTRLQTLAGDCFVRARRRAKYLLLDLESGRTLLVHLGMTGKWVPRDGPKRKHARLSLHLDDAVWLDYIDPRRFGRIRLLPASEVADAPEIRRLGPDALTLSETPKRLRSILQRTRRDVKVALLDQSLLAGVGNIYAAEALFRVGVDPRAAANTLGPRKTSALARALGATMRESLARETDDEITYLQEAKATNPFDVYGREGEACVQCGAEIRRFVQQARSTFWCPRCQRPKT